MDMVTCEEYKITFYQLLDIRHKLTSSLVDFFRKKILASGQVKDKLLPGNFTKKKKKKKKSISFCFKCK